jgi:hypothetical protein
MTKHSEEARSEFNRIVDALKNADNEKHPMILLMEVGEGEEIKYMVSGNIPPDRILEFVVGALKTHPLFKEYADGESELVH